MVISSGTPTNEVLPDLKEFPEPPLDLTSDSVPVEDPTKSKCRAISESVVCRCVSPGGRGIEGKVLFLVGLSTRYITLKCWDLLAR